MVPAPRHNAPIDVGEVPRFVSARLRSSREQMGMSVRELARRVDVSPSFISQIENGKANPSVGTLLAIVSALGITLDELFSAPDARSNTGPTATVTQPRADMATASLPEQREPVLRASERRTVDLAGDVRWERLTPDTDPSMTYLYVRYEVGGESSPADALMQHRGREYGIVLGGRLGAQIGIDTYELEAGDSIVLDCTIPHRFWTIGDEPAVVVWAIVTDQH